MFHCVIQCVFCLLPSGAKLPAAAGAVVSWCLAILHSLADRRGETAAAPRRPITNIKTNYHMGIENLGKGSFKGSSGSVKGVGVPVQLIYTRHVWC